MSILGLILLLTGTVITAVITMNYRGEADEKRIEIERISKENKKLNDSINQISKRNEELLTNNNKELAQSNLELSQITVNLSKSISLQNTEGESFPDFNILTLLHEGEPISLIQIVNYGDNPLFNVHINYFNQDELPKPKPENIVEGIAAKMTTEDMKARSYEYVEEIQSGGNHQINKIYFKKYFESEKLRTFRFKISTRTKLFYATLQLRVVNDQFQIAKEVKEIEDSKGKVIEKLKVLNIPVREVHPQLTGISEIKLSVKQTGGN